MIPRFRRLGLGWLEIRLPFRPDSADPDPEIHPRGARRIIMQLQLFRRVRGSKRMEPASAHPRRSWLSANDEEMLAKQLGHGDKKYFNPSINA